MILGIGIDIINIERIEKLLKEKRVRFLEKFFTPEEIKISKNYKGKKNAAYFAKRFAAKEAVAKALGTGIGKDIAFKDIEISNDKSGKPMIKLSRIVTPPSCRGLEKGGCRHKDGMTELVFHLSLSDEYPFAVAMVVAEKI